MRILPRRSSETDSDAPAAESRGGLLRFLVIVALLSWLLRSLVVAPFSIPTGSMIPTLYIGDYLFVTKWPYGYSKVSFPMGIPPIEGRLFGRLPDRGDVVVFRPPGSESDFVKRVIGLPGDTIAVQQGMLILNGQPLPREPLGNFALPISINSPCRVIPPATQMITETDDGPACLYPAFRETLPGGRTYAVLDQIDGPADQLPDIRVPQGHLFLMGDNRDDSLDSRFLPQEGGIGFVPVDNLIGKAGMVFWSTDGSASYWKPWTWFTALRGDRIGTTFGNLDE
ncbi:MAG: signal peptidase I [Pseudomonadota bacterium]|nr:signal peptidase I [Pseudomonadota bacterium]